MLNRCLLIANNLEPASGVGRIVTGLCFALSLCGAACLRQTVHAETPAAYLQKQTKPVFKDGHGLPRLTRFGWTLPFEARVELARNWAYALELGGCTTERIVERLQDPESTEARLVELARSQPETFPLQVILSRKLPTGDVKAVAEPPSVAETEPVDDQPDASAKEDAHFKRPGVNPPGSEDHRTTSRKRAAVILHAETPYTPDYSVQRGPLKLSDLGPRRCSLADET
ncbi:MAG: hypothetical protein ACQESR_17340 [Planctomycetota bacterium]